MAANIGRIAKSVASKGFKSIKKVGFWDGDYIESALKGAAAMGVVGGITEWAQGGSFVSGFGNNMVMGGVMGAGSKALRIGAMGTNWRGSTMGDVAGAYRRSYGNSASYWGSQGLKYKGPGVSKQVTAIQQNRQSSRLAEWVTSQNKKNYPVP